jgi:hypothetical protein
MLLGNSRAKCPGSFHPSGSGLPDDHLLRRAVSRLIGAIALLGTLAATPALGHAADLNVTLTGPASISCGGTGKCTVKVQNPGPSHAVGVT